MDSMIVLQNNLQATLNIAVNAQPALNESYWGRVHESAPGEQTNSLFWVSRSAGIPDTDSFRFSARTQIAGIDIELLVELDGTWDGSIIQIAVRAGDNTSEWSADRETSLTFVGNDGKSYRLSGSYVSEGAQYDNVRFVVSQTVLPQINHIVVLMLENRSFDNLLGWLYDGPDDEPEAYIPNDSPHSFNGLTANTYTNSDSRVNTGTPVPATRGTTNWPVNNRTVADSCVPDPDPGEKFDRCRTQISNGMGGFLTDYMTSVEAAGVPLESAKQIMQAYAPEQIPVLTGLAKHFAVSDAWHASVPSQTWPNRAFVQAGASAGHVNNDGWPWNIPTIFDVLETQGLEWRVYNDSMLPSLTSA